MVRQAYLSDLDERFHRSFQSCSILRGRLPHLWKHIIPNIVFGESDHTAKTFLVFWSSLAFVGEYLIWTYIWFYLAWGLNYFRMDFYSRTGIRPTHFSSEAFNTFLHDYTEGLNASYLATGSKLQTIAPDLMATIAAKAFNLDTTANLGLAALPSRLQAKPMLFPRLMSGVGVTGYMGPFLAEFHISQQLLPSQYPFTYLHELSHLLGVSNEAEANFHAYLGCVASDEAAIRFSGYFSLLPGLDRADKPGNPGALRQESGLLAGVILSNRRRGARVDLRPFPPGKPDCLGHRQLFGGGRAADCHSGKHKRKSLKKDYPCFGE